MKYFIPSNFEIEKHLAEFPSNEIENFCNDKLLYVLSLPILIKAKNKNKRTWSGYVPINAKTLKSVIGNSYNQYLEYLVSTGVFETSNKQYIVGAHSTMYRHTSMYRGDYRSVGLGKDFQAKLVKANRKRMKEQFNKPEHKKLKHLYDWFEKGKLELDINAATIYLHNSLLKGKVRLREDDLTVLRVRITESNRANRNGKSVRVGLSTREKLIQKYYSILLAAQRIAEKDYFFKMDEKAGRAHTSLTNLKKELRNFLTYDGKRLVEVDIKNSQPFFSLALLNKDFFSNSNKPMGKKFNTYTYKYNKNTKTTIQKINTISFKGMYSQHIFQHALYEYLSQTSSLTMVHNMIEGIDNKDISHYMDKVLNGELYEYLLEEYRKNTGREDMDRKAMKKLMFTILFSKNEKRQRGHESFKEMKIRRQREIAKETFRGCFPKVMQVFEFFKEDNHRLLACLLQSIEAHVVLDKICSRIKRERPGMPIFTVHDSILTTEGNEVYLKRIIEEECIKGIGVKPMLEMNLLHPSKLEPSYKLAA